MLHPEIFVKSQFPATYWSTVPTILKSAYAAVDDLFKDTPFLEAKSAEENRGRFITYAVDFGFERAIKSGTFDCDYRWKEFARPTGRYLELRFSHSTASVSQVSDPVCQPRAVVFRENARLRTQAIFPFAELEKEMEVSGLPHFLFIHGHQTLEFAHIGVPSATSNTKFSWRSPNFMKMPHAIGNPDEVKPEDTDYDLDAVNLIKEDIEKWIRDNGDD
ncbi:hypothetical protein J5289_01500 [Rhizobium sp. B230/85]|uniref:hypothetical protein n=1 Tax=unclassified Rhizobium TaxID=2613769 RepID=UPI001ADB9E48|nr:MULTISPECIES: hypothetical protein [unclassified Rhizobium]MBO9135522.1 hypothetical protein [Rhizobium sp. B209b/85]QXZ96316.1 hypothetical protein J5289_01500 [Rhizobium sp. B230/85]